MPARKCLIGKIRPTQTIHPGGLFPSGMKTPDKKSNGRMTTLTIGSDASAFGMIDAIANPSAQNAAALTTSMTSIRTRVARGDVGVVESTPERGRDRHEQNRNQHRVQYPGAKERPLGSGACP